MSRIQQFLEAHESYLLSLQFPMLLAIATIFCIFLLFKWLQFSSKKKNLPPSPPKLPIVGNLHQIGLNPHRSLRALSQRYGPLMLLRLGKVHVLVISSADTAREIMRTHDLTFANRPKLSVFEKLLYGCKDMATSPYGEHWKQIRSLCVIHLLSNKRVQSFHGIRFEETSLMIDKIKKLSSSSLPINLSEIFVKLANDITCRVALGKKYSEGEEGSNFKELLKNFVELLGGFNVSDYIPWLAWVSYLNGLDAKLEKVAKGFDDLLEGVIAEHEERMIKRQRDSHAEDCEDHQDFVDVLLRLQNEKTLGFSFDREFMKAAILMAPGSKRTMRDNASSSTTPSTLNDDRPRRRVRGPTRGAGLESMINAREGQRIPVTWSDAHNVPENPEFAAKFSSDIGFIVRSHANLAATTYSKLTEREREDLYEQLLVHFDVDLTCEKMKKYIESTSRSSFTDFRNDLRVYYDTFPSLEEAKRNPPQRMKGDRAEMWEKVCDVFDSPRFKRRSEAGKKARALNKSLHRGGSRRFQTLANRRAKERGVETVDQVEIYKETHFSAKKGWIQSSGDSYERMMELRSQPTLEGSQPLSDMEVMSQVLGAKSGYCRGMGYGPKPPNASRKSNFDTNLRQELEETKSELSDYKARLVSCEKMMDEMRAFMIQMSSCRPSSDASTWSPPPPPPPAPPVV